MILILSSAVFFYTSYRWKNQSIQYINNYEYTKFQNNLLQFEEKLRLTSSQSANSDKKVRNRILIYAFRQIFHDSAVLYQNDEELYNGTAYDFDVQGIQEQLGEVELHGKWYDADTYICDPLISKADGKTLLLFFYSSTESTTNLNYQIVTYKDVSDVLESNRILFYQAGMLTLTGFSPVMAQELCYRASIDGNDDVQTLDENTREQLYTEFTRLMEQIRREEFTPVIVFKGDEPVEYGVLPFSQYGEGFTTRTFESVSEMLETYYASRDVITRIRQKSADLRKIVQTALDRNRKKLSLQQKQMKDTEKKDKYKVYGELINTYGYGLEEGCKSFKAVNYYNGEEITIPLDPTLTPQENSKKYFDRYGKLKRTQEALEVQIADTTSEIEHLESISNALDIAAEESDLSQIKEELMEYGYVKRHYGNKKGAKMQVKSKPFHYVSSDGYDIYVGTNNYQNDELTFKFATGNDWWFHAKKMAGSHVIVKTPDGELPDRTFEEAGRLAAYYSKGRTAPKVEIDYIQKKHVKKPAGAKPGFVVYYTNYSLMAPPDITDIKEASQS